MIGSARAGVNMLTTFGETIQLPDGTVQGIFRDNLIDTRLGRAGKTGVGLNLTVDQPTLFVAATDAPLLTEGTTLIIQGQSWTVSEEQPKPHPAGLMQITLSTPVAPGSGSWR